MFGFSLTKLVFTIVVVAAVWYGFKWMRRVQDMGEKKARARLREARRQAPAGRSRDSGASVEEMVECPACGDYVPASGMKNCGRADCPYPG